MDIPVTLVKRLSPFSELKKNTMSKNEAHEPFQWTNCWNQYYATFVANFIMLGHGCVTGWSSPALAKLTSDDTPLLSGILTNEESSWIGSINCIGGLCGSLLFGYVASLVGYKRAMLILTFPSVAFWLLIYFANVYYDIVFERFISGCAGGGIQMITILYISEIANDNIRGRLGSITQFLRNIGILVAYGLGATVDYNQIPLICISFPIVFGIVFFFIPNTPQYLLRIGQIQRAENALKYYKGYEGKSAAEDDALFKEFEKLKAISCEQKIDEKLHAADFFNRNALKGLGIGFALAIIAQFSANFVLIVYAVPIFDRAGASIDSNVSSFIMAVALILGSLLTTYLADTLGRKILNLVSLMGSAAGLYAMSVYHYLYLCGFDLSAFVWVPVVSLSFVIFISSAGIIPLSLICSMEYLPAKIRTPGMTLISVVISAAAFVIVKLFPILLEIIDMHGCMFVFGSGCFIGYLFVFSVMEETSGQSLDGIGVEQKKKIDQIHAARLNSI